MTDHAPGVMAGPQTCADVLAELTRRLTVPRGKGGNGGDTAPRIDDPAREAIVLLRGLGFDPVLDSGQLMPAQARAAALSAATRRAAGVPMAYILGRQGFWTLDLAVTPDVLIPRPDTETLVQAVLDAAPAPRRVLDLGVGSGAIVLSILSERPAAFGVGVDRSLSALGVARANAAAHGLDGRCGFVCADWDGPLIGGGDLAPGVARGDAGGSGFDLVVSNPPYIPDGDIVGLQREVVGHEPHMALAGGGDGLAFYRRLAAGAGRILAPGGVLAVEFGVGQGPRVASLFTDAGLTRLQLVKDLTGKLRVAIAFWP